MEGRFKMAFTYPISLDLATQKCLVVGGGQVAERKILSLLEQEAVITVVSPELTETLLALSQQQTINWRSAAYQTADLQGQFLVIAATNQPKINLQVARDCQALGLLVNVIDQKEAGNFIVNAHFTQGDLQISVSTSGVSPALARQIKEQLAEEFGLEYKVMLEIVKEARQEALATITNTEKRRAFLQSLAQMDLTKQLKQTSREDVQKRVRKCLSSYWD